MQVQPPEVMDNVAKLEHHFANISLLQSVIRDVIQDAQALVDSSAISESEGLKSVLQRVNLVKHELSDIEAILRQFK